MTRCVLHPFYSQQDKRFGQFLLDTCGATKQLAWLADKLEQELQWDVTAVVPRGVDHPFRCRAVRANVPNKNQVQRIHWDTDALKSLYHNVDIAILNHETLAIPLRALFPELVIVQMCTVKPEPLLILAWHEADLVVMQGDYAAREASKLTTTPVVAWKWAYDETKFSGTYERDVDVCFASRCSANNYTHHEEFLEAVPKLGRVVFVDVTKYLRMYRPDLAYLENDAELIPLLQRSSVVVAFNDNWYGGLTIREAIRAGCLPVVLRAPCYEELVGPDHDGFVDDLSPASIVTSVRRVSKLPTIDESYQSAWPKMLEDLLCLSL